MENRFQDDIGNDCLLSVDGTDFQVPFHGRKWYSYKFNGSALRYEVALCIRTGWICWINGPFLPGIWNDLEIFRSELATCLEPNERVEADDGYEAEAPFKVKCPSSMTIVPERKAMMSRVGKRQETVNRRFKQWKILSLSSATISQCTAEYSLLLLSSLNSPLKITSLCSKLIMMTTWTKHKLKYQVQ